MTDISVTGLVKSFENNTNLLDGVTFQVDEGERVGLLGRNGAGKTTIFRILTGELEYDAGEIALAPGRRMGLISQIPVYPEGYTVEDVLRSAFAPLKELQRQMEELAGRMAREEDPRLVRRYGELSARFEAAGGYDAETALNKVAAGLDISGEMRGQLFASLSGGEKTRVNLARLILEDTDILLLDEPTNHLDVRAVEWLEEYLSHFRGTVLVISHDRYFLDQVVSRVVEIENGKAEFYNGNYSFYVEEKEARYEEKLKRYETEQAKIAQLSATAERMHGWAQRNAKLHRRAFAMEKRIGRMEKTDRPVRPGELKARFHSREFHGDEALLLKDVSKSYGDRELFREVNLLVEGGERVALVGDNGTGKTTLLRMILGEESPDTGKIRVGPAIRFAYLPQLIEFSHPERSLMDTMIFSAGCSAQSARNRLAAFHFQGDDVLRPVSSLSGGERSRLRLCMLMEDKINFLILDEPTNHLDIQSREWIEQAVEEFTGNLLFVSHDRYFVSRFATRVWELDGGRVTDFDGGYEAYRRYREQEEKRKREQKEAGRKKEKTAKPSGSGGRRKDPLTACEKEIAALEAEKGELEAEMECSACDYEKLEELQLVLTETENKLASLYEIWEELAGGKEGTL